MASLDELALVIFFFFGLLGWAGYHVLFCGPISQVDQTAAFATEGEFRVAQGNFLFADRTLHTTALMLTRSVDRFSVSGSSVPTTSSSCASGIRNRRLSPLRSAAPS